MRRYDEFTVADFIQDDFFLTWVKHPTSESDQFWEQWLILHPDRKSVVLEARQLALSIDFRKTPHEDIPAEAILNRIRNSIREKIPDRPAQSAGATMNWRMIAVAATIFIAVVSGVTAYLTRTPGLVTVDTGYNERKRLILPDQSVVVLNAHSSLRYASTWKPGAKREVWLNGEAFFEVTKSATSQKFLVHTENVNVEVLGTTFNVINRRGRTQVVLNTGRVRLIDNTKEKTITMKPGELAELSRGQDVFVTRQVNPTLYTSWTANQLIFQQSTLKEIMQVLEDNYGYKVESRVDGMEDATFTGTIPTVDLDTVLYVLSEAYGVNFEKLDEAIVISARERR